MSENTISDNENQDIFFYYNSSLTLNGTVTISNLYYNFTSSTYPKLKVLSNFNESSSVNIILTPTSGTSYPTSVNLFTLEEGFDVFTSVNNFTVTGEDDSVYEINDYGTITKAQQ